MNYDRRMAEWGKRQSKTEQSSEHIHLVKWVWALILIAFVLALMR